MLKCMINQYQQINIKSYANLYAFLKTQCAGYEPRKAKILEPEHMAEFLKKAPNEVFLGTKVISIFYFKK